MTGVSQPVNQSSTDVKPGLMPGNALYGLEKIVERAEVRIAGFIGGPDLKSKALANNAEERLAEAQALSEKNRSEKASKMVEEYSRNLNNSRTLAARGNDTELKSKLDNISARNTEKLEEVQKKVPETAKESIQKAIEKSRKDRSKIQGKPSTPGKSDSRAHGPPGKVEKPNTSLNSQGSTGNKPFPNLTGQSDGNRTPEAVKSVKEGLNESNNLTNSRSESVRDEKVGNTTGKPVEQDNESSDSDQTHSTDSNSDTDEVSSDEPENLGNVNTPDLP